MCCRLLLVWIVVCFSDVVCCWFWMLSFVVGSDVVCFMDAVVCCWFWILFVFQMTLFVMLGFGNWSMFFFIVLPVSANKTVFVAVVVVVVVVVVVMVVVVVDFCQVFVGC